MSGIINQIGARSKIVSGNVGIGSASPDSHLHIYGTGAKLKLEAVADGDAQIDFEQAGTRRHIMGYDHSVLAFKIARDFDNDDFCVDNSGNVGIGTATPYYDNGVFGSDVALSLAQTSNPGVNGVSLELANTWDTANNSAIGQLLFLNLGNSDSGGVDCWTVAGIQSRTVTTDSNASADGGGDLRFSTKAEAAIVTERMIIDSSGNIRNGANDTSWHTGSDIKMKRDVETVTDALDKVKNLRGISFLWDENYSPNKPNDKREYGFIAQEVQEVIPDLVHLHQKGHNETWINDEGKEMEPSEELLGVDDRNGFEAVIVEAIKELSAKVEELEAKIN